MLSSQSSVTLKSKKKKNYEPKLRFAFDGIELRKFEVMQMIKTLLISPLMNCAIYNYLRFNTPSIFFLFFFVVLLLVVDKRNLKLQTIIFIKESLFRKNPALGAGVKEKIALLTLRRKH